MPQHGEPAHGGQDGADERPGERPLHRLLRHPDYRDPSVDLPPQSSVKCTSEMTREYIISDYVAMSISYS